MRILQYSNRRWLFILFPLLAGVFWYALIGHKTPRNNRTWDPSIEKLSSTEINGTRVKITNVRDWTYAPNEVRSREWRDAVEVNVDDLKRVWFLLEPFPNWNAVGHTYLTFEFSDGDNISFSVEARREVGEEYSAFKGLFRSYELAYTWGTERDFLTRRLLYLDHTVRMYPLTLEPAAARSVFLSLAKKTNELKKRPSFYNTLTANCTNVLAQEVNRVFPKSIAYDLSWNLPGSSDIFLMKNGFIAAKGNPAATITAHDLTAHRQLVAAIATSSPQEFSDNIRELLNE